MNHSMRALFAAVSLPVALFAGFAQAAPIGTTVTVVATASFPAATPTQIVANCPAGMVALSGGVDGPLPTATTVQASGPSINGTTLLSIFDGLRGAATGWYVFVRSSVGNGLNTTASVAVVCSAVTGVQTSVQSSPVAPGTAEFTVPLCPDGTVATGGGVDNSARASMMIHASAPFYPSGRASGRPIGANPAPTGWIGSGFNTSAGTQLTKVAAVCAPLDNVSSVISSVTSAVDPPGFNSGEAASFCPVGTFSIGGGIDTSDDAAITVRNIAPVWGQSSFTLLRTRSVGQHGVTSWWLGSAASDNPNSPLHTVTTAAICAAIPVFTDPSGAQWNATGAMANARVGHTSTLMLNNGRVLVTGGITGFETLSDAQLYDPAAGTWTSIASMTIPRSNHTATRFGTNQLLAAGGVNGPNVFRFAEILDTVTNTWSSGMLFSTARWLHTATLIGNGKIVLAGGLDADAQPIASTELFDPATKTFSTVGSLNVKRGNHKAQVLNSSKVLVVGGEGTGSSQLSSAEVFDPLVNAWTLTVNLMSIGRSNHTVTLLADGRVLVAGGGLTVGTRSADLYDPATNSFNPAAPMNFPRLSHTATLLGNGKVLVAGGSEPTGGPFDDTAELYDPLTNTWTMTDSMVTGRSRHTATLINDGKVLVAGGVVGLAGESSTVINTPELYKPPCAFTLNPTAAPGATFTAAGGGGPVLVTANAPDCVWTSVPGDAWITVDVTAERAGSGTVNYTVAPNASATARIGSIAIAGQSFAVTQTETCTYTLTPPTVTVSATGGPGTVGVAVSPASTFCNERIWTAHSNDPWITIGVNLVHAGIGNIAYTVDPNTGPARTGTITVAGQTHTVNQAIAAAPQADVVVTVTSGGQTTVLPNGTATFTVSVQNIGPATANNTVVTDPIVTGMTKTAAGCSLASGGAACPAATTVALLEGAGVVIASLPAGGKVEFIVAVTVTAGIGLVTNSATATLPAGTVDPVPGNNTGTSTLTVTPPGAAPQTGWWWNPNESGRGFFMQSAFNQWFLAGYFYAADGRGTWAVAGGAPTTPNSFIERLVSVNGGQTLTGPYKPPTSLVGIGEVTLVFSDATHGTLTWPGGTIAIERQIYANGTPVFPNSGWWWNKSENGRGFSIEVQGDTMDVVSFMYDAVGNPLWYISTGKMTTPTHYEGTLLLITGGQTMTGPYKAPTASTPAGTIIIDFTSNLAGTITLRDLVGGSVTIPIEPQLLPTL